MADDDSSTTINDGFDGYEETTVDPGYWLLLITTIFCFFVMLVVVPLMVWWKRRTSTQSGSSMIHEALQKSSMPQGKESIGESHQVEVTLRNVARVDPETRKILGLAVPFTFSALASSLCSNGCLILVSRFVGTKAAAAYAIVQVLVGLSDGVLKGPISACTTLCAHAVGAGNSQLAGEYIQLAVLLYLIFNIPVIALWYVYMYDVVLYLEWGDHDTAQLAQDFIRVYIFSYQFAAISTSLWQLLEITNHAAVGSVCSVIWGASNVILLGVVIFLKPEGQATLQDVGWVYNGTSLFFIGFTYLLADCRGWLKPFRSGLYKTCALKNIKALNLMLKQAVPLSFGYLLSNAEWAVLTFMASHLGPAEVAAWAILGSIWDVFYVTTGGIGDAAEIRVSHHLGVGSPTMAQLSAYKSLFLGMVVASIISLIYFFLQNHIPRWFTNDETLQKMLRELVPFVGVANLTMTFGMQCWSLIGAQGKYSLATWVSFISSWGICMPLAAMFTYVFNIDLQGLAAACTIGYVSTGATLSYLLLCTDWYKVAHKIQSSNADTSSGKADKNDNLDKELEELLFASLTPSKRGSLAAARRNIILVTVPAGRRSGIVVGSTDDQPGNFVLRIRRRSPLYRSVHVGNAVLAINGQNTTRMSVTEVGHLLRDRKTDRVIAVVSPEMDDDTDSDDDSKGSVGSDSVDSVEYIQSGHFWNDGFFGYLSGGKKVKQAGDYYDDDHTPYSVYTNSDGIMHYGLTKLKIGMRNSSSSVGSAKSASLRSAGSGGLHA